MIVVPAVKPRKNRDRLCLVIHNVRSAYNVGAILRTADGAGVLRVYLTGYSAVPDRGVRSTPAGRMIAKTALGAEKSLALEKSEDALDVLNKLRGEGFILAAIEQDPGSVNYVDFQPTDRLALICGNEVEGLSPTILRACDVILEIPMRGGKNSLNVAVAAGVVTYRMAERMSGRQS